MYALDKQSAPNVEWIQELRLIMARKSGKKEMVSITARIWDRAMKGRKVIICNS